MADAKNRKVISAVVFGNSGKDAVWSGIGERGKKGRCGAHFSATNEYHEITGKRKVASWKKSRTGKKKKKEEIGAVASKGDNSEGKKAFIRVQKESPPCDKRGSMRESRLLSMA